MDQRRDEEWGKLGERRGIGKVEEERRGMGNVREHKWGKWDKGGGMGFVGEGW